MTAKIGRSPSRASSRSSASGGATCRRGSGSKAAASPASSEFKTHLPHSPSSLASPVATLYSTALPPPGGSTPNPLELPLLAADYFLYGAASSSVVPRSLIVAPTGVLNLRRAFGLFHDFPGVHVALESLLDDRELQTAIKDIVMSSGRSYPASEAADEINGTMKLLVEDWRESMNKSSRSINKSSRKMELIMTSYHHQSVKSLENRIFVSGLSWET